MTSPSILARRACAVLAAISAGLHAAMLGHASSLVSTVLLVVMIITCLYCAHDLWRNGAARAWVTVALMNLAMIALHLPAPADHHGAPHGAAPTLTSVATLLALTEIVAATAALYVGSRGRMVALSGTPDH